jgi:hypothetical protein
MRCRSWMRTITEILSDGRLVDALHSLDLELCGQLKARGCPRCGGVLDVANYERKPRGGPWGLQPQHCRRLSLCCRVEGCRGRARPPSVLFLGRQVYLSVVVVLAGVLRQGPTPWRMAKLSSTLGADRRTLSRWRSWWTERVGSSRTFEIARAELMPPPDGATLPKSLLDSFMGTACERLRYALSFLARHFGARFPRQGGAHAEDAR